MRPFILEEFTSILQIKEMNGLKKRRPTRYSLAGWLESVKHVIEKGVKALPKNQS